MRKRLLCKALVATELFVAVLMLTPSAFAQAWPNRPVKLVVAFAAGSGSDVVARVIAAELNTTFNQSFIVENKPGASAQIAAEYVAKSAPDGYTLLVSTNTVQSANPWLFKKLNYAPLKDFTSIGTVMTVPYLLVVEPKSPFASVADIVEYAKANPGKLTYGFGNSTSQVAGAAFTKQAGIGATAVPYKSLPTAMTDLMGGQLGFVFVDLASSQAMVKGGRIKTIAFTLDKRYSVLPDVPTVAETPGFTGFEVISWIAIVGPAGMAPDTVERLSTELRRIIVKPEIKAKLMDLGGEVTPGTPQETDRFLQRQLESWRVKIRDAGIQPE